MYQNYMNKPAFMSNTPNSGFGASTSSFGQPAANTSMFSSMQPSNIFQTPSSSSFTPGPSTQTSFGANLFGQQPQPSTSGLFGGGNAFGQNKTTFGFGSTPAQTGLFGQQPQQQTGSSLFQSSTPNLFGSSAFGNQTTGTVIKFSPVTGTDTMQKNGVTQSISTKHHCITCMKEYENKSLEELRFEDYSCSRKGPQQQAGFGTAPFGTTTSGANTSLFGQTDNKQGFGQPQGFGQTPAFGQTTPAFGVTNQANTSSLFGKPNNTFGATTSTTPAFGFNATPSTANPFSANQAQKPFSQPLFGNTTTQAQSTFGTGVFGQTNTPNTTTNLFQKPAQPTTGFNTGQQGFSFNQPSTTLQHTLFQASKPNTGFGIFGQTTTTPGFSQTTQPTFGTNFGKMPQTTLTQTSQPAFGTNLSGGLQQPSLFGNTTAKPPSLFGNTTGGSLFNSNVFQQTPSTFSLNMNQPQPVQFPPDASDDTKNMPFIANDSFPDGPHFTLDPLLADKSSTTNPQDIKAMLDYTKTREEYSGAAPKIRVSVPKPKRGDNTSKEFFEANKHLRSSHKCLIIRKFNENPTTVYNKFKSDLVAEAEESLKDESENGDGSSSFGTPRSSETDLTAQMLELQKNRKLDLDLINQLGAFSDATSSPRSSARSNADTDLLVNFNPLAASTRTSLIELTSEKSNTSLKGHVNYEAEETTIIESEADTPSITVREEENVSNPAGVVLTRPEYYMYPDLKDLHQYMNENGECVVQGLTIGRKGYGNIYFLDPVNITNMNFDELVHFRHREVIVYPDDSKKPPIGEGLNKRAQVTLDKIYPREKDTKSYITDVTKIIDSNFVDKLMAVTLKHDSKFVDYRPKTGSWVFNVKHFSKYGFTDSDDEACEVSEITLPKKTHDVPKKPEIISSTTTNTTSSSDSEDLPKFGLGGRPLSTKKFTPFGESDTSRTLRKSESIHTFRESPDSPSHEIWDEQQFVTEEMYHTRSSIQAMKASLFTNLESTPEKKESESVIGRYESPYEVVTTPRIHSLPDMSLTVVPQKVTTTQRCYTELGVFKCNTYKVGWSKGLHYFKSDPCVDYDVIYAVTNCSVNVGLHDYFSFMLPNIADMLQITLDQSEFSFDDNQIPTLHIKNDLGYLQKQTKLFNDHADREGLIGQNKYLCSVWNLCSALWGPGDNDPCSRRQYVSDWLQKFAYELSNEWTVNQRMNLNETETFTALFKLLSFYKIAEACDFASKNNLNQLTLLISQLSANERVKFWNSKYIDNFIWREKNLMLDEFKRVHLLLSGIPLHETINICEDLDWLRTFGLHLWYIAPAAAPLSCAFNLYSRAFEEEYANKPVPPYCDYDSETTEYDVLYHILGLYVDCTYQLCKVLHPETHTENVMDYRLSWFMLHLFRSLNVGLIRDSEKEHLHTTFSTQLEHMGLWEWAIFALLFLENNHLKKNLIMRILERNLSTFAETTKAERELVKTFRIPPSWIHEVKAIKAKLGDHYYDYFQHCLYMGDWRQANATFVDHILPDLFINEHYGYLKKFIQKLEPYSNRLVYWNSEVGLFKEFMALESSITDGTETPPTYIAGKLSTLFRRISCFRAKNDKQRLCAAQLSRKCALIFKLLENCMEGHVFRTKFVDVLSNLLMPPDMMHNELFYLIYKFVSEEGSV